MPALALAVFLSASAVAPPGLAVPAPSALVLRVQGRGVQIYTCQKKPDPSTDFGWALKAPRADLIDAGGIVVGRHYAGPTWEFADGGKVVGKMIAKMASPDPQAVDWLLLSAGLSSGVGRLANVRYVQRLDTKGGRAPADGCSSERSGAEVSIPYTAEYDFYAAAS